jgi:Dual-action HEIGH metallo-peptidase
MSGASALRLTLLLIGIPVLFGCAVQDAPVALGVLKGRPPGLPSAMLPASDGLFVINGDILVSSEQFARESGLLPPPHSANALTFVDSGNGQVASWQFGKRTAIRYCVSNSFDSFNYVVACRDPAAISCNSGVQPNAHSAIVNAMNAAVADWQSESAIRFVYDSTQDGNCTGSNQNVDFHVEPANLGHFAYAQAGFPNDVRSARRIQVGVISFFDGTYTLTGILKHELGHILGLRHEFVRSELSPCEFASACCTQYQAEMGVPFVGFYAFDNASIMMYPTCTGIVQNLTTMITANDRKGLRAVYGPRTNVSPILAVPEGSTLSFYRTPLYDETRSLLSMSIGSTSVAGDELFASVSIAENGYSLAAYSPATGSTRFFTARNDNTLTQNSSTQLATGAELMVGIDVNDDLLTDLLIVDRDTATLRLYLQSRSSLAFNLAGTLQRADIGNWRSAAGGWDLGQARSSALTVLARDSLGDGTIKVFRVGATAALTELLGASLGGTPEGSTVTSLKAAPFLGPFTQQIQLSGLVIPSTPLFLDGAFFGFAPPIPSLSGFQTSQFALPDTRGGESTFFFFEFPAGNSVTQAGFVMKGIDQFLFTRGSVSMGSGDVSLNSGATRSIVAGSPYFY